MLYCHFEHQSINVAAIPGLPATPLNVTRLQFSTDRYYGNSISGKAGWDTFNNIKNNLIKQIPASNRDYDPTWKIWTIHTKNYDVLRMLIDHTYRTKVEFLEHPDLEEFLTGVRVADKKAAPKAEDFYYNYGQPIVAPPLTLEDIQSKLLDMISLTQETALTMDEWVKLSAKDMIKAYRKAAMQYHPDRNGGDGSRMTELNYFWQQYKEMTKI